MGDLNSKTSFWCLSQSIKEPCLQLILSFLRSNCVKRKLRTPWMRQTSKGWPTDSPTCTTTGQELYVSPLLFSMLTSSLTLSVSMSIESLQHSCRTNFSIFNFFSSPFQQRRIYAHV